MVHLTLGVRLLIWLIHGSRVTAGLIAIGFCNSKEKIEKNARMGELRKNEKYVQIVLSLCFLQVELVHPVFTGILFFNRLEIHNL